MKKVLPILLAIPLAGCHFDLGPGVKGSGTAKTETRQVESFSAIRLDGVGQVIVKVGSKESLKVIGDDNLLAYITTEVKNGTLVIDHTEPINPKTDLVFEITTPNLERLELDGAGEAKVTGISGKSLALEIDGAGSLEAEGTVDHLDVNIDGAGAANTFNLKAKTVKCDIDGAGSLEVFASDTLDANVDGAGSVSYKGSPKVASKVDGAGSISKS